jgi:membrane-associated PAP2 superfamily phosphatase
MAWLPVAGLAALAVAVHQSGLDLWLADRIYAAQDLRWGLRHHVLTANVLHDGGRLVSQLAWASVVIAWLLSHRIEALRSWQCALGRLALSALLATAMVATLKHLIPVHCPWDLVRYGGTANIGDGGGVCFPSGHASAGYAWMALARVPRSTRWRRTGLATGIAAGLLFGLDQQLRGAHFLSHDLWAAALCWAATVIVSPSTKVRKA